MTTRQLRIAVRGGFGALTPDQRRALLDDAAAHDPFRAAFTPAGSMSYELQTRPFFVFRVAATAEDDDLGPATGAAEDAARAWLEERGLPYRLTRTVVQDLSTAPLAKRQRRAATRG